jgi:hypothetical protein
MRRPTRLAIPAFLAAFALGVPAAAFDGGEPSRTSDPCGFFRSQAYGRGIEHYATEMLWACEAIAGRREREQELSLRLEAVELALERYREAVVAAGSGVFAGGVRTARAPTFGPSDAEKAELAESTGMLAALEAIRAGF